MKKYFYFIVLVIVQKATAQNEALPTFGNDTLQDVTVHAFMLNKKWKDAPVAVALISQADIQRSAPTSLLPVLNAVAGVRMEERSPGSYRLSIRGSTLRSPFGVRNVKVYWNDIPLTDGGGNTYLNLVDVRQINNAEVIKGPSSSVYGAGTGGVLLLNSVPSFTSKNQSHFNVGITGGSYGLFVQNAGYTYQNKRFTSLLQQSHLQSNSYRQQSAVRRDTYNWIAKWQTGSQIFDVLAFYTNMYYQTPGGLTLAEMLKNPTAARPATGTTPGAVEQKSAIFDKTAFAGIHHSIQINSSLSAVSVVLVNDNVITNPFLTKYENRDETNTGISSKLIYQHKIGNAALQWVNGGEWLYNHSRIDDYVNNGGVQGNVQFKDNLFASQWYVFSQLQLSWKKITLNAGVSFNNQQLQYRRLTDSTMLHDLSTQNQQVFTPRFSLGYQLTSSVSWYAIAAKGFSPPTLAEFFPQDRIFHSKLKAEYGWNIESGIKGSAWNNSLQFDVAAYHFQLQNAIVMRVNAQGAQYFVNSGGALEKGIEVTGKYRLWQKASAFISQFNIWGSFSYQPYYFSDYKQGNNNYTGNAVTGVPKHITNAGIDMATKNKYYLHLLLNATAAIPLNDSNTNYANAYQNLQLKMGRYIHWKQAKLNIFCGIDNLLNQNYSLGNDINAFGGRYYNPAPSRNYYAGINFSW